jgi:ABC-type phosphate transport system substrate-binding protein
VRRRRVFIALGALALAAQARAQQAPGLAVIVHPGTPVKSLTGPELAAIFSGGMKYWKSGPVITIFNAPAISPARTEFDSVVLNMTAEQVSRYWLDRRIRGEGTPPRQVPAPELVARLVATLPGAIGYVPEDKVGANVRVVARIRNHRVVAP